MARSRSCRALSRSRRAGSLKLGPEAGPGESEYTHYDRSIADAAAEWLKHAAPKHRGKPWALYVGFVSPHFPLIAPPQFYDLYPESGVPWPAMYGHPERPRHPFIDAMRRCLIFDEPFDPPMVRRAVAAYFGLVSFLDENVGGAEAPGCARGGRMNVDWNQVLQTVTQTATSVGLKLLGALAVLHRRRGAERA